MNIDTAARLFRESTRDAAFYEVSPGGRRRCIDPHARAEAWGIFTDQLCKSGQITMKQYESWGYPWERRNT